MIFNHPSEFVTKFVNSIHVSLQDNTDRGLSKCQRCLLSFCVMAVIVTNSICWARFARACLGRYSPANLSRFFIHASICWENLLEASVRTVLREHGITGGVLVIDDTDKKRSKTTTHIWGVSKLKDKASSGYMQGQCIVLLLLVTPTITLPVGFAFHRPDPAMQKWLKKTKELRQQGALKKDIPKKPKRNPVYLTKIDLSLQLLTHFKKSYPQISVKAVLADAAFVFLPSRVICIV